MQDVHLKLNAGLQWQNRAIKEKDSFQIRLTFKEYIFKMLHFEKSLLCCWNLGISERGSEIPWKFRIVVLEKDVEDHSDWYVKKFKYYVESKIKVTSYIQWK